MQQNTNAGMLSLPVHHIRQAYIEQPILPLDSQGPATAFTTTTMVVPQQ